jgi:hypothetical protein
MPQTANPHPYFHRAAVVVAIAIVVFWLWRVLQFIVVQIRGDIGP